MCLSHFARADRLDVLRDLLIEHQSWTTTVVRSELAAGAKQHAKLAGALALDWIQVATLDALDELSCFVKWTSRLGSMDKDLGEASVLAAAEMRDGTAITDDRVRRRSPICAEVHGTVWLLASACRDGKLTPVAAGNLVDALRAEGARLPCTGSEFPAYAAQLGLT